jgi:ATP-dependent exoDNAse (exonuclease V) alpha subunit
VGAYAYICGEKAIDLRTQTAFDFSRKKNVRETGFGVPEGVPLEYQDPKSFWNRCELFEDEVAEKRFKGHKDFEKNEKSLEAKEKYLNSAQTAYTVEASLPIELSFEDCLDLVKEFTQSEFVDKGHGVSWAIHWEEGNPHVHFNTSTRTVNGEGFSKSKDREFVTKAALKDRRKAFEVISNKYLERSGSLARVDCRSYKDRGLEIQPGVHEGYRARLRVSKDLDSRIVQENQDIQGFNRGVVLRNPQDILRKLASENVVFTSQDIKRELIRYLGDDIQGFQSAAEYLMDKNTPIYLGNFLEEEQFEGRWSPELRGEFEGYVQEIANEITEHLLDSKTLQSLGEKASGETLYSTHEMIEREGNLLKEINILGGRSQERVSQTHINNRLFAPENALVNCSSDQREAVAKLCGNETLSHLIGRAGTGKTTLLKVVKEVHESAGFRVLGMTFQGSAADVMESKIGCRASTIDKYIWAWREQERLKTVLPTLRGKSQSYALNKLDQLSQYNLTSKDVVIVDEANMVGHFLWEKVIEEVSRSGAKLITAGDDHQAKGHGGSDIYRALLDQGSKCEITRVFRQKEGWQQRSSTLINQHNFGDGLRDYNNRGCIKFLESKDAAIQKLVEEYMLNRAEFESESRIILSYTNKDVDALNGAVRQELLRQNLLGSSEIIGGKEFSIGDKIVFTKNDNGGH